MHNVTVIVPAYNAGETIGRTLESLLVQTMPVDVIVVNDGSTDGTASVVSRYVDRGVRLVTQENAGGYQARAKGLKHVTAEYFGFADADDTVEPTMYERMYAAAKKNDLDVVQCEIVRTKKRGLEIVKDLKREVFDPILIKGTVSSFVWDKLYRNRGVVLEPAGLMMFDDLAMNLQLFEGIKSFGYLHEGLYHYNVNAGSSVRNFRRKNIDDLKEIVRFREKYLPRYGVIAGDPVLQAWIDLNFRNYFKVAASAKCGSWAERMENVRFLYREIGRQAPSCLSARVAAEYLLRKAIAMLRG